MSELSKEDIKHLSIVFGALLIVMLFGIVVSIYVENYKNLFISIFGFIAFLKLLILMHLKAKNISEHKLAKLFLASLLIYPTLYFGYTTLQKHYFFSQTKQEFCGTIEADFLFYNKGSYIILILKNKNQQYLKFLFNLESAPSYKIGESICITYIHDTRWQKYPHIFHIKKN